MFNRNSKSESKNNYSRSTSEVVHSDKPENNYSRSVNDVMYVDKNGRQVDTNIHGLLLDNESQVVASGTNEKELLLELMQNIKARVEKLLHADKRPGGDLCWQKDDRMPDDCTFCTSHPMGSPETRENLAWFYSSTNSGGFNSMLHPSMLLRNGIDVPIEDNRQTYMVVMRPAIFIKEAICSVQEVWSKCEQALKKHSLEPGNRCTNSSDKLVEINKYLIDLIDTLHVCGDSWIQLCSLSQKSERIKFLECYCKAAKDCQEKAKGMHDKILETSEYIQQSLHQEKESSIDSPSVSLSDTQISSPMQGFETLTFLMYVPFKN